ncbi:MAG TPA: hypothetical protein VHD39_04340, partial [Acidimicrobiales bacterium]|nr:hypothetical protein [Acidimicrobiales bacterium]
MGDAIPALRRRRGYLEVPPECTTGRVVVVTGGSVVVVAGGSVVGATVLGVACGCTAGAGMVDGVVVGVDVVALG